MKFRVKDDDGRDYVVEEVEEEKVIPPEIVKDDEMLSADEIKALRDLLAVAPQLMNLLKVEEKEHAATEEAEEEITDEDEELVTDDDEMEEETEEKEELLETKSHDSKKAFGAIEKKERTQIDDSLDDNVSDAWTKRYGGIK